MDSPLRVIITEGALKDLTQIADYIAMDSPQNAGAVVDDLLKAMESLDQVSGRFKVVGRRKSTGSAMHAMVVGRAAVHRLLQRRRCAEGRLHSHDSARASAATTAV